MPFPRITGLLQNCALNSALPIIINVIEELADREKKGKLKDIAGNPVMVNYERLKNHFAKQYGIAKAENFTWASFSNFISSNSFYENEIIFAPVLRSFIAEMALSEGSQEADLGLLRDIQDDGVYNLLHYTDGALLLHNKLGITLKTYEYIADRSTGNTKDNYNLVSTRATTVVDYPFGDTPVLDLYYRGAHFEIQPHEDLAHANEEYEREVRELPDQLREVHDAISFAQVAYESNAALAKLYLYVSQTLNKQLATEASAHKKGLEKSYIVTPEEYAANGHMFDENNSARRLTFAVILLTIASDSSDQKAKDLLRYLDRLAASALADNPMGHYLSDQLAKAIIQSKMNLNDALIETAVEKIKTHDLASELMRSVERKSQIYRPDENDSDQLKFVKAARDTIRKAWHLYHETRHASLIEVIKQTERLVLDPSPANIKTYQALSQNVSDKGSWGKIIAGCMLTVVSLALIIGTAVALSFTVGVGLPITAAAIGASVTALSLGAAGFFGGGALINAGQDQGLYKRMQRTLHEATDTAPKP